MLSTGHGPYEPLVRVLDDGVPLGAGRGHVALLHILHLRDSDSVLLGARGLRDNEPLGAHVSNFGPSIMSVLNSSSNSLFFLPSTVAMSNSIFGVFTWSRGW
jgi:hypothetical protein